MPCELSLSTLVWGWRGHSQLPRPRSESLVWSCTAATTWLLQREESITRRPVDPTTLARKAMSPTRQDRHLSSFCKMFYSSQHGNVSQYSAHMLQTKKGRIWSD